MSALIGPDASFSSTQELLDLKQCPLNRGTSEDMPSPADSQTFNSNGSVPGDSNIPQADGYGGRHIFTVASTVSWEKLEDSAETPTELKQNPTDGYQLCGWGAFEPKVIQVFNTPSWLLLFLCVASFIQGIIVNGFINSVITTLERRFNLQSSQSAFIVSSYDISSCICLPCVSYVGGKGHKSRWLGWGMLIMALGSLVFSLPHFTTPPYEVNVLEDTGMCPANRTSPYQDNQGGGISNYLYVFILGQVLHGIGASPLYTLGVTYLEENVNSNNGPVYIGLFYTASIVGPAVGFLLGGHFLTFYTDVHLSTEMTPADPLWVGAWWIGFLGAAAAAFLVALPIFGYPRELPGFHDYKTMRVSEAHQIKEGSINAANDPQFGKSVKDMPRSVLLLLKNPTFLFLSLAGAADAFILTAFAAFFAKIMEAQLSISASYATSLFGLIGVPAGGGCTFLGGFIVKKMDLRCKGIIGFCLVSSVICLLCNFFFLARCPNIPVAGVTTPYQTGQPDWYNPQSDKSNQMDLPRSSFMEANLTADCNADCGCSMEQYNPVCGADGVMYYSTCHAGCRSINHTEPSTGRQVYSGCSCVVGNVSWGAEGYAVQEICSSSCSGHTLIMMVCGLFLCVSFTFITSTPALTATLRCVPESQKSFALGIQWILIRTLGSIPGPIVFGALIDTSCLLWQNQGGEKGSCYIYHNISLSTITVAFGGLLKILSISFFSLAHVLYRPPPPQE